jgi:hypothetical protein
MTPGYLAVRAVTEAAAFFIGWIRTGGAAMRVVARLFMKLPY